MVYYKVPQRSSSQYLLGHSQIHMEGSPNYDNDDSVDDDGDRENIKKQLKPIVHGNLDLNIELDILPGSH